MAYDINQQIESLSDRLNKIDQYSKATVPEAFSYFTGLQRPEGANPLPIEAQKLTVGTLAKNQYDSGMKMLTELLGLQKEDEQFNKNYTLEQQRLALDAAKNKLEVDANGNVISTGGDDVSNLSDAEAVSKIRAKYGKDIYLGETMTERGQRARDLLALEASGGEVPINDLYSPKELDQRKLATDLMRTASDVLAGVTDQLGKPQNTTSVGILGGRGLNPNVIFGRNQSLRNNITGLTAAKMKEFSGVAVSDREVKRLQNMLPKVTDTEAVIAAKAKNFVDTIDIGMKMQDAAKRENITLDKAYEKYAAPLYQQAGMEVPPWLSRGTVSNQQSNNDPLGLGL